jgi:phosphoenolpyruvate-protein phosphotransferase
MKTLQGIPAVTGIALGVAHVIKPLAPITAATQRTCEEEIARLTAALNSGKAQLATLQATMTGETAEIIATQHEILDDPELYEQSLALIQTGISAEAAVTQVIDQFAQQLASLPDPYLAARADDARAAGRRIIAELQGITQSLQFQEDVILIAQDLSPAEVAERDLSHVQAIVTEEGAATGHLAIVAQGWGIPTIVGMAGIMASIENGQTLVVDGEYGTVTIDPDEATRTVTHTRLAHLQQQQKEALQYRDRPGMTADRVPVAVLANIGSLADARKAVEMGAEGVGLFRTEFLAANGIPSEDAQVAYYTEIAKVMPLPITIRTFDIGGDKPVPGLNIPPEGNPFLGWRGIRLGLDRPEEILLPQLRAILRAATVGNFQIMLPMVVAPQEATQTRALLDQALSQLEREGKPARRVLLGIMVETPAAALTLDHFRGLIDFASIGTNDLVQYTFAVDRTNPRVQARAQPLGLATLRLLAQISNSGIPISICGQLAADPQAIPLLVGLGIRKLSVAPASIPKVKQLLASQTLEEMQAKIWQALRA